MRTKLLIAGMIILVSVVAGVVTLWIYLSPYPSCIREREEDGLDHAAAVDFCDGLKKSHVL